MTVNSLGRLPALAGLVIAVMSAGADGHEPTESLAAVPENSWLLVDHGGVTSALDIMAYSSGWYDSDAHQFCLFGGGHFNYSGNEVWCFDIASLAWHRLYEPDALVRPPYSGASQLGYENYDNERYPGVLFEPAGEALETARPFARHTYDTLEFIPGRGAVLWGGFAWGDGGSPWCTQCPDTWIFDFEDVRWHYRFNGKNHAPNASPGVGASAWSPADDRLYAKVLAETWTYDPEENRWDRLRTAGDPPWTIEGTLEYDPQGPGLYFFGGNYESNTELWHYDIERRSWRDLDPAGDGPVGNASSGPGLAFDTRHGVLAVYFGGTIWIYDPAANRWESRRPDVRPSDQSYVFGRFRYDPVNNGFWLHNEEDGRHATWFYRYRD